ncbi:transposase [Solibacillus sp. FSL W7-1324]|uniref:transposase n=1 Tax=Solibacillus sp. FSL W7-1324 TaxID=2921701 RepID=UPI0030F83E00
MIYRALKLEVKRPLNIAEKTFLEVMKVIQLESWRLANKGIRMFWDYEEFDYSYMQRYGEYFLKRNETLPNGYKNVRDDIINEFKFETVTLCALSKDAIMRMVEQKWRNDLPEIKMGNVSIPSFNKNLPLEIHNKQFYDDRKPRNLRINNNNNVYSTEIRLINTVYAKSIGLKNGNIHLELIASDNKCTIIDAIISGEYKLGMSQMRYDQKKKKWFLILRYSFKQPENLYNPTRVMGIDIGKNVPIAISINDKENWSVKIGSKEEIENFTKQILNRRKRLAKSRKYASEGSVGHGKNTRMKPLGKISTSISNFNKDKYHKWSKAVIDIALKEKCGTIQMENLKGVSEKTTFCYDTLQRFIEYKAEQNGINVVKVNPYCTSRRCSNCGYIDKNNRTVLGFKCKNCSFRIDVDYNASRNLSVPNIEKIIQNQLHLQSIKDTD